MVCDIHVLVVRVRRWSSLTRCLSSGRRRIRITDSQPATRTPRRTTAVCPDPVLFAHVTQACRTHACLDVYIVVISGQWHVNLDMTTSQSCSSRPGTSQPIRRDPMRDPVCGTCIGRVWMCDISYGPNVGVISKRVQMHDLTLWSSTHRHGQGGDSPLD